MKWLMNNFDVLAKQFHIYSSYYRMHDLAKYSAD